MMTSPARNAHDVAGANAPVLLHVFPSFAVGGAQVRLTSVINRFGSAWQHAIVAMDGNLACRERLAPEIDVRFPAVPVVKGDLIGNLRRFRAALREMRPHRLITHNWGAIEWAMANALRPAPGLRHVAHIHIEDGFGPEERSTQIRRRVLTRRLVLRGSTVVLPSRTLCAIARDVWRLPESCLRYIPNGVDLRRFAARPEYDHAEPVIGTVAALRPEKNLARLLRAFATVPGPARLAIVGDGAERPMLEALASELGLAERVRFLGHQADPGQSYAGFSVFALSSDTEQMPLTVLEAMAAGLPVAATDVGDVAAMLAEENRPYVTGLDHVALGQALAALVTDPGLARRIGAANHARAAAAYDQETMFQAYASLFGGVPA